MTASCQGLTTGSHEKGTSMSEIKNTVSPLDTIGDLIYYTIYTIMIIDISGAKEENKMSKFLSDLLPGEAGVVKKVLGTSMIKRRIVDMGVVAGTIVEVQKFAPLGDPMEIKVKGFNLSLRKNEAEMIELEIT